MEPKNNFLMRLDINEDSSMLEDQSSSSSDDERLKFIMTAKSILNSHLDIESAITDQLQHNEEALL